MMDEQKPGFRSIVDGYLQMGVEAVEPKEGPVAVAIDSDWEGGLEGRCYRVYRRLVRFRAETSDAAILAWAERQRRDWYGQEFTYALVRGSADRVLAMRKAVDSGD